ncbi:RNA polymerase sigma factor [Polaribacter sp. WD7]|nr:RNA polymerase sigma factor [uncultured Polaribacter sp.]RCS28421.1 RNA polymerase sigma factor [Polaribacter sp. WD7]
MKLEQLIKDCCKKQLAAQSKVYQLFSDKLFAVCLKYARNYQDAEDILQDSFLIIFDKIQTYKYKGSFEGWLKRITINTALQKYRIDKRLSIVEDVPEIKDEEDVEIKNNSIEVTVLLSFVQELPDRYRLVFNLYVLDKYSHKEIATLLHISEGTSKSNLSRARLILKNKIQDYQDKQNTIIVNGK